MITVKYMEAREKWGLFNNDTFIQYAEESMSSKVNFINKMISDATILGKQFDIASDDEGVYFDRGYDSGGGDPITQTDLDPFGINLSNFTAMITLKQQLNKFATDQAVTQGDYGATANKLRNDI